MISKAGWSSKGAYSKNVVASLSSGTLKCSSGLTSNERPSARRREPPARPRIAVYKHTGATRAAEWSPAAAAELHPAPAAEFQPALERHRVRADIALRPLS